MYRVLCGPETPRDQWLEMRHDLVGASDQLNPSTLHRKVAREGLGFESDTLWLGTALEPVVLGLLRHRRGLYARSSQRLLQSITHPFMGCTLDAIGCAPKKFENKVKLYECMIDSGSTPVDASSVIDYKGPFVLEIKTCEELTKDWKTWKMPKKYVSQVNHQMFVVGLTFSVVAVLFNGRHIRLFPVPIDEDVVADRIEKSETFWCEMMDKRLELGMSEQKGVGNEIEW